ncbi:MAG: hypothetical protein RQ715_05575 [Methylococcales bacterium]|nr:hypothetical protein [Methylococcales bacterium]
MPSFLVILIIWFFGSGMAWAQADAPASAEAQADQQQAVERLVQIKNTLKSKRELLAELERAAKKERDPVLHAEIEIDRKDTQQSIEQLERSFRQLAGGGVDLTAFATEKASDFNWQQELVVIARPIFDGLKELTEKSRKVDQLRTEITRLQGLHAQLQQALAHVRNLPRDQAPPVIKAALAELEKNWRLREKETRESLEIARYQRDSLMANHQSPLQAIVQVVSDFFQERAVTLLLALVMAGLVGGLLRFIFHLLLRLYRLRDPDRAKLRWIRLVNYGFWSATLFFAMLAAITVFYARNDFLLLSLTILVVVVLILSLRNTLPRYIEEVRLLLDIGPVRRGERLVYQGVPYYVHSIGVFTTLINPALQGRLRIPTRQLSGLISRPRANDPWFPCQAGDFVMLEGDRFAEVIRQTVENVQLKVMGSPMLVPTADFISQPLRNLSQEGFVVPVTFGIDYQHQADCLTIVPEKLRAALQEAFREAELDEHLEDVLVEFKQAAGSSLDYLIIAVMAGAAANRYFPIGRLIQKTCVATCTREGWGIPFEQLTLHRGSGFS